MLRMPRQARVEPHLATHGGSIAGATGRVDRQLLLLPQRPSPDAFRQAPPSPVYRLCGVKIELLARRNADVRIQQIEDRLPPGEIVQDFRRKPP
jgi:hypothetical protein